MKKIQPNSETQTNELETKSIDLSEDVKSEYSDSKKEYKQGC